MFTDRKTNRKFNGPPAVIVGFETNGLGVARSLALHNINCIGLSVPTWYPAHHTKTCKVIRCKKWCKEEVVKELLSIGENLDCKAPLLITKDEPVLWISEHHKDLSNYYEINLSDDAIVNLLMSKKSFLKMALAEGWPMPKTWLINNKDELMSSVREIVYPVILKPVLKNSEFRKKSPKKAFKVSNERDLIRSYDMVAEWEKEVVVQEWIEGGDQNILYCLTYYNRYGRPLAIYPGRKLRQFPIECGNTAVAAPAPQEWIGPMTTLTKRIFERIGFRGLGSIEYKIRCDSHELVIMEPTVGRTNYQSEIAVINGTNIPAIAYFDLAGLEYHPQARPSKPYKLIDARADFKASLQYLSSNKITLRQLLNDRKGKKKYMVFRACDPGPFLAFVGVKLTGLLRRFMRIPFILQRKVTARYL